MRTQQSIGSVELSARASVQWASRPDDQRFTSLLALQTYVNDVRQNSMARKMRASELTFAPANETDSKALVAVGPNGHAVDMTHWSFGQAAQRARAPASYLRTLPAALVADNLNYGMMTNADEVGALVTRLDNAPVLRALTGPDYGRVWNSEIVNALVERFGDGLTGQFRVPSEFGRTEGFTVTKENTTLYASDRDFFVFLADEHNRIELPDRRNGKSGSLARGFLVWNSEVGDTSLGISLFLFDYACANRTIWGIGDSAEIRIRHSKNAPSRWLDEVMPAIRNYANAESGRITSVIEAARDKRITDATDEKDREAQVRAFLEKRFTKTAAAAMILSHQQDEGRPIESLWDASNAITGYARGITYQDERVNMEREAGKVLALAA
jgi:Domain of unknown function (DUF932)